MMSSAANQTVPIGRPIVREKLDPLQRQLREAERRRAADQERVRRFKDENARMRGRDVAFLKQQDMQKKEKHNMQRQEDRAIAMQSIRYDRIATEQEEQRKAAARLATMKNANYNRLLAQEKRKRDAVRRKEEMQVDKPVKTVFLQFAGEDLGKKKREEFQKEQQRAWVADQLRAKELAEERERERLSKYNTYITSAVEIADEAQKKKEEDLLAQRVAVKNFNKKQVVQKHMTKKLQISAKEQKEKTEMETMLSSDFMNERAHTTFMAGQPHRRVPYHFKGMSKEQLQRILNEQAEQVDMKNRRKMDEKHNELKQAQEDNRIRRMLIVQRINDDNTKDEINKAYREDLNVQKEQKKAKDKHLKRVYTNKLSDCFYDGFGTTCR